MKLLRYFQLHSPQQLRGRLRRDSLRVTFVVSIVFSLAILAAAAMHAGLRSTQALAFLWTVYFAAFWIALRVAGAVAWDTSFKQRAALTISASPTEVFLAMSLFCVPLITLHAYLFLFSLAAGPLGYASAALLLWTIPVYLCATIAGLICLYLPALMAVKIVCRLLPNDRFSFPDIQQSAEMDHTS